MLIRRKGFCSRPHKGFNNQTAITIPIFTMKLCPFYIPAHTSSLDKFQPTVTITGGVYKSGLDYPLVKMIKIKHLGKRASAFLAARNMQPQKAKTTNTK